MWRRCKRQRSCRSYGRGKLSRSSRSDSNNNVFSSLFRTSGISHVTLASGIKVSKVEEEVGVDASDPFKLKTGGLLDLARARQAKALEDPDAEDGGGGDGLGMGVLVGPDGTAVGTQFSRETRVRDEDEEMRKFIEAEMEKRRGKGEEDGEGGPVKGSNYLSPEDRALLSLPEHLKKSTFRKNEEMLSSQMLSGIPEVDLGIEEKIRNIEATESAKKKMAERVKGTRGNNSVFIAGRRRH